MNPCNERLLRVGYRGRYRGWRGLLMLRAAIGPLLIPSSRFLVCTGVPWAFDEPSPHRAFRCLSSPLSITGARGGQDAALGRPWLSGVASVFLTVREMQELKSHLC